MKVLYDPSYSERGVLQAAARVPRAANPLDFEVSTFEGLGSLGASSMKELLPVRDAGTRCMSSF